MAPHGADRPERVALWWTTPQRPTLPMFMRPCPGHRREPARGGEDGVLLQVQVPPQPDDVDGEVAVLPPVEQHDRDAVAVLSLELGVGIDVDRLRYESRLGADAGQRLRGGLAQVAAGPGEQGQAGGG